MWALFTGLMLPAAHRVPLISGTLPLLPFLLLFFLPFLLLFFFLFSSFFLLLLVVCTDHTYRSGQGPIQVQYEIANIVMPSLWTYSYCVVKYRLYLNGECLMDHDFCCHPKSILSLWGLLWVTCVSSGLMDDKSILNIIWLIFFETQLVQNYAA